MNGSEFAAAKTHLLAQLERSEPLDPEKLAALNAFCSTASHDGPCPCGSNKKFSACCKVDWVILRDHAQRPAAAPEPTPIKGKGNGKDTELQDRWICHIGFDNHGNLRVAAEGQGTEMNPIDLAGLILAAYQKVNANGIIANVRAMQAQRQAFNPPIGR